MGRTVLDADLREWEAYASTGRFGFPEGSHVVFRCLTDRALRPRFVELEGDHTDAERIVASMDADGLGRLLGQAREIR